MIFNLAFSNIIHIFVMPKPDGLPISPFQGFPISIFSDEYHSSLAKIICMPTDATEIYMNNDEIIRFRSNFGTPSVFLFDADVLPKRISIFKHHPFVVLTCLNKELDVVRNLQVEFDYPPIIAGIDESVEINLNNFNIYMLDDAIASRMQQVLKDDIFPKNFKDSIKNKNQREKTQKAMNISSIHHGVTSPNENVILSLGYKFKEQTPLVGGSNKKVFIDAIVESYRHVKTLTHSVRGDNKSDLIVYSHSIFSHLYKFKSNFWNQINRQLKDKAAKDFIMNGIFKNPSYSGFDLRSKTKIDIENIINNDVVRSILMARKFEISYTNIAISSLAIANSCPAIRLPNAINLHHGLISDLESLSISTAQKAKLNFNRKYKELSDKIRNEMSDDLVNIIRENESIILCTDAPIEWVTIDRIPLLFTHEISKIHTTTGSQLLKSTINSASFSLEQGDLKKITVIRSFKDHDPIKPILEDSLRLYIDIDKEMDLEVIDVQNKIQFFDALKRVQTKILIFDCHGNHSGSEGHGWLKVGEDQVNTWELPTNVPPIIILSACFTSAIGGSHASVANGLLENGALTILGTLLPVDSIKSAAFVGRITYRLNGYLKALKKIGVTSLTWRKFISDFFKMSFCTDILSILKEQYAWIDHASYEEIHIKTNLAINMNNRDWLDTFTNLISKKADKNINEVNEKIQEIGFVETMNYSLIGRPENIYIKLDE